VYVKPFNVLHRHVSIGDQLNIPYFHEVPSLISSLISFLHSFQQPWAATVRPHSTAHFLYAHTFRTRTEVVQQHKTMGQGEQKRSRSLLSLITW